MKLICAESKKIRDLYFYDQIHKTSRLYDIFKSVIFIGKICIKVQTCVFWYLSKPEKVLFVHDSHKTKGMPKNVFIFYIIDKK